MIDICIVNYKTLDKLKRLLETINLSDHDLWNLYVQDNGSDDGTSEFLNWENCEKYNITNAQVTLNVGYALACNRMASLGTSEIIGLFNADVWINENKIKHWLELFDQHPEIAILGPKQRNERGEIVHAGIFGSMRTPRHRGWKEYDPLDNKYADLQQCLTVSGSAYLIRREVWNLLTKCPIFQANALADGAFLPTPHYFEETWCSYHALVHGYEVWYDGTMGSIGHSWHASSGVGSAVDQNFAISREIFRNMCDYHKIPHD